MKVNDIVNEIHISDDVDDETIRQRIDLFDRTLKDGTMPVEKSGKTSVPGIEIYVYAESRYILFDREEGRVMGFVTARPENAPGSDKAAVISMVGIDKQYRKQGLIKQVYRHIMERGYLLISDTTLSNKTYSLWNSLIKDPGINVYIYHEEDGTKDKVLPGDKLPTKESGIRFAAQTK